MKLYSIKNWGSLYETAETRKLENLRWAAVPNKHDGLGYRRVVQQRERCDLFTAWILIVQVASKGRRADRGRLMRDGRPLSAEDIGLMTGFSEQIFERAFAFFSDPKQDWLAVEDFRATSASAASDAGQPAGSPDAPACDPNSPATSAGLSGNNPAEGKGTEGMEKNGRGGRDYARGAFEPPPLSAKKETETEEAWIARLQREWPKIDIVAELRKAMRKKKGELERGWFERSWLKNCDEPVLGANGKIVEPEPEGWKVMTKDANSGESREFFERAAIYPWVELPDGWRAKICREWQIYKTRAVS